MKPSRSISLGDVDHLVQRRRDQARQADHVHALFAGGCPDLLARHHHAQVDDLVVVAAEDDADDVLADVVDVALDRGHERSCRAPVRPPPPLAFSASMNGSKYATAFFMTRALLTTCGKNILPAPNRSPTTFMPSMSGPSMTGSGASYFDGLPRVRRR